MSVSNYGGAILLAHKAEIDSLKEELTKLRAFVKDAKIMAEFYGNWKSWSNCKHSFFESYFAEIRQDHEVIEIVESDGDKFKLPFGGRRAREFLSKHKELIKGEA
jgi:hypothetical protein